MIRPTPESIEGNEQRQKSKAGFSIIELMLAVMILSILASVAMPSFSRFVKKSKMSEAYSNLRKLYDGEIAYFYADHTDRNGNLAEKQFIRYGDWEPEPPTSQRQMGNWEGPHWNALGFLPDGPVLFSYYVYAAAPGEPSQWFVVGAASDFNDDGWFGTYERSGWFNPNTGEMHGGPGVFEAREVVGVQPWE